MTSVGAGPGINYWMTSVGAGPGIDHYIEHRCNKFAAQCVGLYIVENSC